MFLVVPLVVVVRSPVMTSLPLDAVQPMANVLSSGLVVVVVVVSDGLLVPT